MELFSQGSAYAANYTLEAGELVISAGATEINLGDDVITNLSLPEDSFELTEDGAELSVERFGIVYTLRMLCDEPSRDQRCMGPAFLLNIASKLMVAWPRVTVK